MFSGFIAWSYLQFLPNLVAGGVLPSHAFAPPAALAWLWPRAVADYSSLGVAGPAALASLTLNVAILVVTSLLRGVALQDRRAARVFVAPMRPTMGLATITAKVGDLELWLPVSSASQRRADRWMNTRLFRRARPPSPPMPPIAECCSTLSARWPAPSARPRLELS